MKREVKVGIFAVAVLLVGWGVARYLKGAEIFSNTCTYYAYYEQVGGLQPASRVVINGVKVGSVARVSLNEDPSKGVELELSIEKRYAIPVDSKAKIFTDGLMGGKAVEIIYGKSGEAIPDEGTITTEVSPDLFEMAGSELGALKDQLTEVVEKLSKTLDGVNTIIEANSEALTSIIANVDGVTGNINTMLANEKDNLEQALSSLSEFSKSLGDNSGEIDAMIDNLSKFSAQLSEANLVAELEGVMSQVDKALSAVNSVDGSVGKLLRDTELYDNLTVASDNLSALLEDLKVNPSRYINVSVFGSNPYKKVDKAKAKAEKKAIKREMKDAEDAAKAAKKNK